MNERTKVGILCVLLLLVLAFAAFAAANALQSVRNLQQQYREVKAGDVSTIRPWMTIYAISHIYHVPEDYLYLSLETSSTISPYHTALYQIANRKRQPVDQIIHTVQRAILAYRKNHHSFTKPPQHQFTTNHPSPAVGRTEY
jgi:hypothetical protein